MARGSSSHVFFARDVSLDDAEARLRQGPLVVRRQGDALHACWRDEPPEAIVSFARSADVAAHAQRLAGVEGIAGLARCDRRFEIRLPDLEPALAQTNTLAELQMTLGDLTDGYVYNAWNGLFLARPDVPAPRARLELDALVAELPRDLDALRAEVKAAGFDAPLDLSYDSLDVLEDALAAIVPRDAPPYAWRGLRDRAARYLGATLIARRGGRWAVGGDLREGEPVVLVPSLPKTRPFAPIGAIVSFQRHRVPGWLRSETERWDLPLRRARLDELLGRRDDELASFARDVHELTGEAVSQLDASSECFARVERALEALITREIERDRKRVVRERAELFVGTLFERAVPGAAWSIRQAPAYVDFGRFLVGQWSPSEATRVIRAGQRSDWLGPLVARGIEVGKNRPVAAAEPRKRGERG